MSSELHPSIVDAEANARITSIVYEAIVDQEQLSHMRARGVRVDTEARVFRRVCEEVYGLKPVAPGPAEPETPPAPAQSRPINIGDRIRAYNATFTVKAIEVGRYRAHGDGDDADSLVYMKDAVLVEPAPTTPAPATPEGWEATGEVRTPRAGEWYIFKGSPLEACGDLGPPRHILRRKPAPTPDLPTTDAAQDPAEVTKAVDTLIKLGEKVPAPTPDATASDPLYWIGADVDEPDVIGFCGLEAHEAEYVRLVDGDTNRTAVVETLRNIVRKRMEKGAADAHAQGRREGMEQAAKFADDFNRERCRNADYEGSAVCRAISNTIRTAAEEKAGGTDSPKG